MKDRNPSRSGSAIVKRGRPNRREEILQATQKLIAEVGISGTTTRKIAEAVPCSEGALYVHFANRADLLLAVLHQNLPEMTAELACLEGKIGEGTVHHNIAGALKGVLRFYADTLPLFVGILDDPELLRTYRSHLRAEDGGPHRSIAALEGYLKAEQRLGRVDASVDARTAATLLMASCFFHSFTARFFGEEQNGSAQRLLTRVIDSVLPDKAPGPDSRTH